MRRGRIDFIAIMVIVGIVWFILMFILLNDIECNQDAVEMTVPEEETIIWQVENPGDLFIIDKSEKEIP